MSCVSVRSMIEPYLDGELDPNRQAQFDEHIADCAGCREDYRRLQRLRDEVRSGELSFRAPDELRQRVLGELRKPAKAVTWPWKWMAIAASVLLAVSVGTNFTLTKEGRLQERYVAQEILSEHLRSMMDGHLVDVVSSDRHTVKPWFSGKLDFAPNVKDFSTEGFRLAGGRVDYMDGKPVAALVFRNNQHVLTVFTWPSTGSTRDVVTRNGFNLVAWTKDGMNYWAVSDLNLGELNRFATLYQR